MRFMMMVKSSEQAGPPPKALMEAIAILGKEAAEAGAMLEMGGLFPSAAGARVRLTSGKLTVTDGPFVETKEVVGGYAVFEVTSKKEAIEQTLRFMQLHKEHWPGWDGETEIRQIFERPDSGPESQ